MYNRYIPQEPFQPVEQPEKQGRSGLFSLLDGLLGEKKNAGFAGILDKLGLGKLDSGDILLLLVLIYLFRESEDDEWLIILALVLLMGL